MTKSSAREDNCPFGLTIVFFGLTIVFFGLTIVFFGLTIAYLEGLFFYCLLNFTFVQPGPPVSQLASEKDSIL